jgi:sulfide:quinone oxidoreductase
MKCAGAPLKHTFLIDDRLRGRRQCGQAEIDLCRAAGRSSACRSWPKRCACCSASAASRRDEAHADQAIDAGRRSPPSPTPTAPRGGATTTSTSSRRSARPSSCVQSGLHGPTAGPTRAGSKCDPATLRHNATQHLRRGRRRGRAQGQDGGERQMAGAGGRGSPRRRHRRGAEGTETYNGYTSCPLITRIGRAMLIEFDYNNDLTPLPRHHRAAGRAVDQLADEGGGAEGHLQRHAARQA